MGCTVTPWAINIQQDHRCGLSVYSTRIKQVNINKPFLGYCLIHNCSGQTCRIFVDNHSMHLSANAWFQQVSACFFSVYNFPWLLRANVYNSVSPGTTSSWGPNKIAWFHPGIIVHIFFLFVQCIKHSHNIYDFLLLDSYVAFIHILPTKTQ